MGKLDQKDHIVRHAEGRAGPLDHRANDRHGAECLSVADIGAGRVSRVVLRFDRHWENRHRPAGVIEKIRPGDLRAHRFRFQRANEREPDAGCHRWENGQATKGYIRTAVGQALPLVHRRLEHARKGEVWRATTDRAAKAVDGHRRLVRAQDLGVPLLGRPHVPGRHGAAGRGPAPHHEPLPAPLQLGLRAPLRAGELAAHFHVHHAVVPRQVPGPGQRLGSERREGDCRHLRHDLRQDVADAGQIPLHLQLARLVQGPAGHLLMHEAVADQRGGLDEVLGARVPAGLPGQAHQSRGCRLVLGHPQAGH
mmetsp:Transcript_66784/g.204419  ORF Transcript_66784/g.204419 Transcript_66784/m.204419 type:complete len:309 (+) Transcript_66784:1414-2340(+)